MTESKTLTKGNVIVEEIEVGDIHYEYEGNIGVKCQVITKPRLNSSGNWVWKSQNLNTGKTIDYLVNPNYPAHYAVNLYNYEAYKVRQYI